MKHILLVLDDYNELLFIETLLKKLGFDTLSTQKIKGIHDVIMSFQPAVVVVSETIKDQKGVNVLANIKEAKPDVMGMVLLNAGSRQPPSGAEAFIPRPIDPLIMLRALGEWTGLNEERLFEKIEKLGLFKTEHGKESVQIFRGTKETQPTTTTIRAAGPEADSNLKFFRQTPQQVEVRSKRFKDALKTIPPPKTEKVEKKNVIQEVKEFRMRSNDTELVNIDKERKAFVDALYEKKKKVG